MFIGKLVHNLTPKQNKKNIFDIKARDNVNIPWIVLRESFKKLNCNLITEDEPLSKKVDFELHLDAQKTINNNSFLIVVDNSYIHPLNDNKNYLEKYRLFFSWRACHKKYKNFKKINIPFALNKNNFKSYNERARFSTLISNNKSFPFFLSKNNLYKERIKTIRWFENFALQDFDLYGSDWDKSPKIFGKLGFLIHIFENFIPLYKLDFFKFKSWKGSVKNKNETLQKYKFAIVYENTDKFDDYLTEKIFDCFMAGCVPIYWGPDNICDYIPQNCFIDRKRFNNHHEMYTFLKNISEKQFSEIQNNIKNFLNSESIKSFSPEIFSEIVSKNIINYLLKKK